MPLLFLFKVLQTCHTYLSIPSTFQSLKNSFPIGITRLLNLVHNVSTPILVLEKARRNKSGLQGSAKPG